MHFWVNAINPQSNFHVKLAGPRTLNPKHWEPGVGHDHSNLFLRVRICSEDETAYVQNAVFAFELAGSSTRRHISKPPTENLALSD